MKYQAANVAVFRRNRSVNEEGLSDEVRPLRPIYTEYIIYRAIKQSKYTELMYISCLYGRIMDGENTLEKAYNVKITKYVQTCNAGG
jgi:hypothetical protein